MTENGDSTDGESETYTCAVEGCDYSNDATGSMQAHSASSHYNPQAWKTGNNQAPGAADSGGGGGDDSDDDPAAPQARTPPGDGGGGGQSSPTAPTPFGQDPPTPNDILREVLESDWNLSENHVDWIMKKAGLQGFLTTDELYSEIHETGQTGQNTAERLSKMYAETINNRLQKNPSLALHPEWGALLTKETGNPQYQQQAQGTISPPGSNHGNGAPASVSPPQPVQPQRHPQQGAPGQVQPPNQSQPQQRRQTQQPSTGQVHPPNMTGGVQQPQDQYGQQGGMAGPRIEQIRRNQEALAKALEKMSEQDDGDDTDQLDSVADAVQKLNRVNSELQNLSDDDQDKLDRELRQLRKEFKQQLQQVQQPGNGGDLSTLADLASRDDVDGETLSVLTELVVDEDPEVKKKEMEVKAQRERWQNIRETIDTTFDNLGRAGGDFVATAVKGMMQSDDDGGDDDDLLEQVQQGQGGAEYTPPGPNAGQQAPRQPPQQGQPQRGQPQQGQPQQGQPQQGQQPPQPAEADGGQWGVADQPADQSEDDIGAEPDHLNDSWTTQEPEDVDAPAGGDDGEDLSDVEVQPAEPDEADEGEGGDE